MRQIDWYIDKAVENQKLSSSRALGPFLGLSVATASNWRTRRAWPGDATMVRLAEICGVPAEEALLELSVWRTAGTPAGSVYLKILEATGKSAAAIFLALMAYTFIINPNASASENTTETSQRGFSGEDKLCDNYALCRGVGCTAWRHWL